MNDADLEQVNAAVNLLPYRSDASRYHTPEFWEAIDTLGGDCEDFALGKLNGLLLLKWPIIRLRMACCYVETGEYHAVLSVTTDTQETILDNRQTSPQSISDLMRVGYKPDRIQQYGGSGILFCRWNW